MVAEEPAGILPAQAEPGRADAVAGAGSSDGAVVEAEVQQLAGLVDALAEDEVQLGGAEGGGDLVLDHLDSGAVADLPPTVLELLADPHVQPDGGVVLERSAAWDPLGVAEQDAGVVAELVDQDH